MHLDAEMSGGATATFLDLASKTDPTKPRIQTVAETAHLAPARSGVEIERGIYNGYEAKSGTCARHLVTGAVTMPLVRLPSQVDEIKTILQGLHRM